MQKCNFIEDFKIYLDEVQGFKEGSIKSYVSYTKTAFKKYMKISDVFSNADVELLSILAEQLHKKLYDVLQHPETTADKPKTIKNYRSGLVAFMEFLGSYDEAVAPSTAPSFERSGIISKSQNETADSAKDSTSESCEPTQTDVPDIQAFAGTASLQTDVYENKDLFRIFKSRLITQDRIYSDGTYLPCRMFNKLFSKDKSYKELIKSVLAKTVFLLDGGDKAVLSDVKAIAFEGNEVFAVLKNGVKKAVITEVHVNGQPVTYEKIRTERIRDLSLDHDVPLVKLVNENILHYPNMMTLSNSLIAYKNANTGKGYTKSKLSTYFMRDEYSKLRIDKTQLLNELCDLYNKVNLTIMLSKYNSSKNKN